MSLNAMTASSSYAISAGLDPATIRQNTQPSVMAASAPRVYCAGRGRPAESRREGAVHGYLSQVQAAHQEERQPRQAGVGVGPQDVPLEIRRLGQAHLADRARAAAARARCPPPLRAVMTSPAGRAGLAPSQSPPA